MTGVRSARPAATKARSASRSIVSTRALEEARAEEVGGDVLDLVGLVEDRQRRTEGRTPAAPTSARGGGLHGEVGEEEVVVDDQERDRSMSRFMRVTKQSL